MAPLGRWSLRPGRPCDSRVETPAPGVGPPPALRYANRIRIPESPHGALALLEKIAQRIRSRRFPLPQSSPHHRMELRLRRLHVRHSAVSRRPDQPPPIQTILAILPTPGA